MDEKKRPGAESDSKRRRVWVEPKMKHYGVLERITMMSGSQKPPKPPPPCPYL